MFKKYVSKDRAWLKIRVVRSDGGESPATVLGFHLISKVFRPEFEALPAPADRAQARRDRTAMSLHQHSIAPHLEAAREGESLSEHRMQPAQALQWKVCFSDAIGLIPG